MIVPPKLTLDQINNILAVLDTNIDIISDRELTDYVKQITTGLPFQTLILERGLLYRGRPNEGEVFFHNLKDLWYPPLNCVKCNRFNDEHTQILYVAESKSTVIEEVKPAPGSLLTLTTYSVNSPIKILPIGIRTGTTKTHLFSPQYLQGLLLDKIKIYKNNTNYMQIDSTVNNYLHKHVTKENTTGNAKEYRFTNAYGNHFFKAPVDGILYPSVSRKLYDINMALKIEAAKKLKITQVEIIKIDDKFPNQFKLIAGSNDFKSNGEIIYSNNFGSFDEMTRIFK